MKIPKLNNLFPRRLLCLQESYVGQRPDGSKFNGYSAIIKYEPEEMLGITPNGTKFYKEKKNDSSLSLYMQTRNNVEIVAQKKSGKVSVVKSRNKKIVSNTENITVIRDFKSGEDVILKMVKQNDKLGESTKGLPKFVRKLFELM